MEKLFKELNEYVHSELCAPISLTNTKAKTDEIGHNLRRIFDSNGLENLKFKVSFPDNYNYNEISIDGLDKLSILALETIGKHILLIGHKN